VIDKPQICAALMKNLRLKPDIHKHQAIVKASSVNKQEWIDLVKKQKSAKNITSGNSSNLFSGIGPTIGLTYIIN
jgi:hypothetical protein